MTVGDLLLCCLNDDANVEVLTREYDGFRILNDGHLDSEYAIDHFGDLLVSSFGFSTFRYTDRISGIVKEIETICIYIDEVTENG